MRTFGISFGIFYGIYLFFAALLPMGITWVIDADNGNTSDLLIPSFIYVVLMCVAGAGSDFKLFIQNGFSRTRLFCITLAVNTVVSVIAAGLSTLAAFLINSSSPSHFTLHIFVADWYSNGTFSETLSHYGLAFLVAAALLIFASTIGLTVGLFLDRVSSGTTKLVVIALIVAVPFLLLMLVRILPAQVSDPLINFFAASFGVEFGASGITLHAGPFIGTLLVVSVVLAVVAYLLNRRREVRRVNA